MTAVCTRYRVSATQAYRWLEPFLEGGHSALVDKRTRRGRDPLLDENRHLKELVGQQALSIEAQKSWPESWDGNGASTSRETDGGREAVESSFGSSRNG
jgi:transposase